MPQEIRLTSEEGAAPGAVPLDREAARVASGQFGVITYAQHSTRQAATRDRRKDDDLATAGYGVTRFTADQILHDPEDTLARTKRVLGSSQ